MSQAFFFIEQGERSIAQLDLDDAYSKRDDDWDDEAETIETFTSAINYIGELIRTPEGSVIQGSRLRNQADFYSLFGAVVELQKERQIVTPEEAGKRLADWLAVLQMTEGVKEGAEADAADLAYVAAARSASNDPTPRRIRIDRMKAILKSA